MQSFGLDIISDAFSVNFNQYILMGIKNKSFWSSLKNLGKQKEQIEATMICSWGGIGYLEIPYFLIPTTVNSIYSLTVSTKSSMPL